LHLHPQNSQEHHLQPVLAPESETPDQKHPTPLINRLHLRERDPCIT